jgi:hypothetical protein
MRKLIFALMFAAAPAFAQVTCVIGPQCDAMWSAAADTAMRATRMRLSMVTLDRIETYSPTNYDRMGAIVTKRAVGDDRAVIEIEMFCYRGVSRCYELTQMGSRLFYAEIVRAANYFPDPRLTNQ